MALHTLKAQITSIEEFFVNILGNRGYAFAEVTGNPEVNENTDEVEIIFTVDPGKEHIQERFYLQEITLLKIMCWEGNETVWRCMVI